jgi:tryptophanyl-tRNA synthetase
MSLIDGRSKMSKSEPNEGSRINLLDSPDLITRKIRRAKTDPVIGLEFGNTERPEADNLLGLYALLSGRSRQSVLQECAAMGWGQFKPLLAEVTVEALRPLQERYAAISAETGYLDGVLRRGRERATAVAGATLERVRNALGFLPAP